MADPRSPKAVYEELVVQHHEVMRLSELLARLVRDPGSQAGAQLAEPLDALRRELSRHFASEETGGYLSEFTKARPDLDRKAAGALAQHQQILDELDSIRTAVGSPAAVALGPRVTAVLELLRAHEACEIDIVNEGALRDFGDAD